mgnify:CR=1 FL=1
MPNFLRTGLFAFLFSLVFALQFNIDDPNGGGGAGDPDDPQDPPQDPPSDDPNDKNKDKDKDDDQVDLDNLDPKVQKMIKDLRKENAKHRTKAKENGDKLETFMSGMKKALGMEEDDQVSPEEQVQNLSASNAGLEMQNAVLGLALENGLNKDQAEYLQFLIQKEAQSAEEDEEISDEVIESLVAKVKTVGGANGGQGSGSSTPDDDGKKPSDEGSKSDVTPEAFAKMGYSEKVGLMRTNKALYDKLMTEARNKGLI